MSQVQKHLILKNAESRILRVFEPEFSSDSIDALIEECKAKAGDRLDDLYSLGAIDTAEGEGLSLHRGTTFTSAFGTEGSGPFIGLRYFPSCALAFASSFKFSFACEIRFSMEAEDELNSANLRDICHEAGRTLILMEQAGIGNEDVCKAAITLLNRMSWTQYLYFDTLSHWFRSHPTCFRATPMDQLALRDFNQTFHKQIDEFNWKDGQHIKWLRTNLKGSDSGI